MGVVKNKDNCSVWANKMTIAVNEVANSSQTKKNVTGSSKSSSTGLSTSSSSKDKEKKKKKVCLCAPPTHPGSFKCRHHRSVPSSKDDKSGRNITTKQSQRKSTGRPAAASASASCSTSEREYPSESPW